MDSPTSPASGAEVADRLRIAAELHASTLAVLRLLDAPGLEAACENHWHRVEGRHFRSPERLGFIEAHLNDVRALAADDVNALRDTLPGLVLRDLGRHLRSGFRSDPETDLGSDSEPAPSDVPRP